jgi:MFS family permease
VRRLLVLVSTVVFVDAMLFGALTPLVPGYADEFELSKTGAGLLVAAFGIGALFGGIPAGLAAMRWGPKTAVVAGLALLTLSSFGFAAADGPWALGIARFVQGFSSTTTWAGALAWLTVATPRSRRGELIGIAFGAAVFGAILGPMFGAIADTVGIRTSFGTVGVVAAALAVWAARREGVPPEEQAPAAVSRAFADRGFLGGLWLNTLPAWLFGTIVVLVPLRLDEGGFTPFAIGAVFLVAGLIETVVNPLLGRFSDRRGRLLPIRVALAASVVVAVAFAAVDGAYAVAALAILAAISFGAFYTPGMALVSDRAEAAGLSQAIGFGIMNTAWALGNGTGPALAGAVADAAGDAVPYLIAAALCLVTLLATSSVRAPTPRPAAGDGSSAR